MPKLDNETELDYKKRVLDTKSASFCGAKWYNATIWLGSGMTTSCHHPLPHFVPVEEVIKNPKALHNTPQKKAERAMMQQGERPQGCEYCWKIEDIGRNNISDRVYKSQIFSDEALDIAYKLPTETDVNLKTLEISFDRTCQFACSYCTPGVSTTWVKDIKNNGPYEGLVSFGRNHYTNTHDSAQKYKISETNPYIEAFFKWWESDLHKTLDELRITGGEPLMSGHTWKLLEWYKENKHKTNTRLAINTNLGPKIDVERFIEATKGIDFDVYTSVESVGAQNEYTRDGLDWELWKANMEKLQETEQFLGLHIMMTINALCLDGITDLLDLIMVWKKKWGRDFPNFSVNIMRFPSFQSALTLPDYLRTHFMNKLQHWLDTNCNSPLLHQMEINQLQRLIDYLDVVKTPHTGAEDVEVMRKDFKRFFTQFDQRRNKNFVETFPAYKDWYESIQL